MSFDDGVTWRDFLVVEELDAGERGELSYPAMIQDAAGELQITYTWNRRRIRHATVPLALVVPSQALTRVARPSRRVRSGRAEVDDQVQ